MREWKVSHDILLHYFRYVLRPYGLNPAYAGCAKQFKYYRTISEDDIQYWTWSRQACQLPFNKVFMSLADFVFKGEACILPSLRGGLPPKAAALPHHGTGFLLWTDAAVLGSCSRLQDRDAAAELTVKRQHGEVEHTIFHRSRFAL